MAFWDEHYIRETKKKDRKFRDVNDGSFDTDSYREVSRLGSKFADDPGYLKRVKKKIKERQQKSLKEIGNFRREDYRGIRNPGSAEGLNTGREQLREINLKNYHIQVDDADTLILRNKTQPGNKPVVIRLSGIDAPETGHDNGLTDPLKGYRINQAQPMGKAATQQLKALLIKSTDLRLVVDPTQKTYGRYLGVLLDGNKNLNLDMVRTGHVSSLEFGKASKDITDRASFMAAGAKAEKAEKGIWAHQFFKNWKQMSQAHGSDITFNTLTSKIKLAENKALGVGAGYIWGEGNSPMQLAGLGQAAKRMRDMQQLSRSSLASNIAQNPQERREDRNTIEGMKHGWFGRLRSESTAFGSPSQDSGAFAQKVREALALDIETKTLKRTHDAVVQVGMYQKDYGMVQMNVTQQDSSYKTKFGKKHFIPQVKKEGGTFTKSTPWREYSYPYGGRGHQYVSQMTAPMNEVVKFTEDMLLAGLNKGQNVVIHNAQFEMDKLIGPHMGSEKIRYTDQWARTQKHRAGRDKLSWKKFEKGLISEERYVNDIIHNQISAYKGFKKSVLRGNGGIINSMEITKTLNAVAQQKGLIPKSDKLAAGAGLDFMTRSMYGLKEYHVGNVDAFDSLKVSDDAIKLIDKIQRFGKKAKFEEHELRWLTKWGYGTKDPQAAATKIYEGIQLNKKYKNSISKVNTMKTPGMSPSQVVNKGALILGGAASLAVFANSFLFSGRDDNYNTIEALHHGGLAEVQRRQNTAFGSGYRMEKYHNYGETQETNDPIPASYVALGGMGAASAGFAMNWNRLTNTDIDSLQHLGKLSSNMTNSQLLGRTKATVGETVTAGVKRAEQSLGGMFRVFGVGDQLMMSVLNNMELTIDLMKKQGNQHAQLLHQVTQQNLLEQGYTQVKLAKNKLWGMNPQSKAFELIPGHYQAMPLMHNMDLTKTPTQTSLSYMRSLGHKGVLPEHSSFIVTGGKSRGHAYARRAHGYIHETFTKGLKLLDEPFGALSELIPDLNENSTFRKLKHTMRKMPMLGTGGDYVGSVPRLMVKHGARLGVAGLAMTFGYGTLDWMTRAISPEGSITAQGGIVGAGAEALKTGHLAYSYLSEATGLTGLRAGIEDMAPGTEGWQTALGLTFSGGLAGATLATIGNVADEIGSKDRYAEFVKHKKTLSRIDVPIGDFNLNQVPGLKGEYTKTGRYARKGALAGLALSLPFLIAGLGSSQTTAEWKAEYAGQKEVAVRKGRFWEASMTPWEGGKIDYYRPNWYARLKDNHVKEALYNGEDISPIGKALRSLWDPYWLEKQHYAKSPYPYTGPDGSAYGMLGPLYELTVGRGLKAPAIINREEFEREYLEEKEKYPVSEELGGLPKGDPRDPSSLTAYLRRSIHSLSEGLGLRGFLTSSIFEKATGESNIDAYTPELESAAKLDSLSRAFYDLQLGGGVLTTEAFRRLMPRERVGDTEYVNPMENAMPSWLPGDDSSYYLNFQRGDAYSKIKEGYYRLPGEGYATRFEELEGMNPEDYPDVYKYKILADVAPDSKEFRAVRGRLQNRQLSEHEQVLFSETERQLSEKVRSVEKFRDPEMYDSLLGSYTAAVTDIARMNPVEQLIPFSPARKFLPGVDPVERYEETVYGKDFKDWKNPFSDFMRPFITMTANIGGGAEVPEEIEYARGLENYFDKIEYIKAKRLAMQAQAEGNMRGVQYNLQKADRTLSGLDPYTDPNELLKMLPKRERPFFEHFINAAESDKEKILETVPVNMREIYQAQWDRRSVQQNPEDEGLREEVQQRANALRARRKARLMDFKEGNIPDESWTGWRQDVDLQDVKMKYVINEGRDYHYYGLWKDRLNLLARKPYIEDAANQVTYNPGDSLDNYADAYAVAGGLGLAAPEVSVLPSIKPSYNVDITVDRRDERQGILRDMGLML